MANIAEQGRRLFWGGDRRWFIGRVANINEKQHTVFIRYNDGDFERHVQLERGAPAPHFGRGLIREREDEDRRRARVRDVAHALSLASDFFKAAMLG